MKLLQLLTQLQEKHGYLTSQLLQELSATERVPLHRLQQLVSFYPHFRLTPPAAIEIKVCRDISCMVHHAEEKLALLKQHANEEVHISETSCIGRCDQAPVALLNEQPVTLRLLTQTTENPLASLPKINFPKTAQRWSQDPYEAESDHYSTWKSLLEMSQEAGRQRVIQELKASNLRGMGGAGFPTGKKWELVAAEPAHPKYVICNADESEPGTFKDALVLREMPHLVIEGMALAGRVLGATEGIIYLRHEYHEEYSSLVRALETAKQFQLQEHFNITIFISPGGYILGEETALLEALEDKRGEPRNKPPFPGTHGLWGQPTLINNVETFANVPLIVRHGGEAWKNMGIRGASGPKLFAVSGHVNNPGVYGVPLGTTIRELIERAGGVSQGKNLLAVAPGGASSNWLPAEQLDLPLDFATVAQAGSMLGSGAVIVVAEGTDMLRVARNITSFFRNESCGKCVPCRVGSQKGVEILDAALKHPSEPRQLELLPDLAETLAQTSICGLGQVAVAPALSIINQFYPERSSTQ